MPRWIKVLSFSIDKSAIELDDKDILDVCLWLKQPASIGVLCLYDGEEIGAREPAR